MLSRWGQAWVRVIVKVRLLGQSQVRVKIRLKLDTDQCQGLEGITTETVIIGVPISPITKIGSLDPDPTQHLDLIEALENSLLHNTGRNIPIPEPETPATRDLIPETAKKQADSNRSQS